MENKNSNTDNTYKRLEELLPEYIFNRATNEEIDFFEKNVNNYPDLVEEVNNVRHVFSKVDDMDFDRMISQKTRNLSVKVNKRLYGREKSGNQVLIYRYVVPTFGLALLAFLILSNYNIFKPNGDNIKNSSENSLFSQKDVSLIIDKNENISFANVTDEISKVVNTLNHYVPVANESSIENVWSDYLSNNLMFGDLEDVPASPNSIQFKRDVSTELNGLTEIDLQDILKEFENVNFNS